MTLSGDLLGGSALGGLQQYSRAKVITYATEQVEKMAKLFGVAEDVSYTCETAAHFWLLHVLARWEKFLATVAQRKTPECVKVRMHAACSCCVCFVQHSPLQDS